jgi:hypothetical protein
MAYQLERPESEARSPLVRLTEREHGIDHWLHRLFARHSARVMLRRLLGRRSAESAAGLPPHLLKDVGLPPDFRPQGGLVHPHPPV